MLDISLKVGLVILAISIFLLFIRVLIGPTMADRVIATDTIGVNLIAVIGCVMILQKTMAYAEVILVIAILSFISTIAFSKFMERGIIFDRDID